MKKRPDRFIAETLVKVFKVLLGKENRAAAEFGQSFGPDLVTTVIADRGPRPAYPQILGVLRWQILRGGQ